MRHCLFCWSPSGRCKFCRECEARKHRSSAIVSQNSRKLIELLRAKRINASWFEKFLKYTEQIKKHGKILMEFKTADDLKSIIVIHNIK